MRTTDFDYVLPPELIAQQPLAVRDRSRLLVLTRFSNEMQHKYFHEIAQLLQSGDLLVVNNTKVIPARLRGERLPSGGGVELLLLLCRGHNTWQVFAKPGRRIRAGDRLSFGDGRLTAEVLAVNSDGTRDVQFFCQGAFQELLESLGETPLPPYIKESLADKGRYQTVYAAEQGSVAAPTAGLHFTPELLARLQDKGVQVASLTLHVGAGTFRPVQTEDLTEHQMHSEYFSIPRQTANLVNAAKKEGRRVIAVGTTAVRTLETAVSDNGQLQSDSGWTDLFIYPGFSFQVVDAIITNFHLPKSSLLMLVAAFTGYDSMRSAYQEAIDRRYRFYSFGDAMLIVP